ncbi:MAG: class I SAM-dependent methyltransferase [Thermodesulfovibrionales bacterium]|jgi:predicted O-methyltransferase YrrM
MSEIVKYNTKKVASLAVEKKGAIQKITEFASLLGLLKRRKLKSIVEIGTAQGGTLYTWCKIANSDALIISIDLSGGPFGGGYTLNDIKKFRKYKRKNQKLYFLRKDSHKQETKNKLAEILDGRKIDFLFIDGDHRYRGVKKDFQLYSSLVKQNGLIVFHDILYHPKVPECKVDKFWNEIKRKYKNVEFIDREDDHGWGQWGGIGVIYYMSL